MRTYSIEYVQCTLSPYVFDHVGRSETKAGCVSCSDNYRRQLAVLHYSFVDFDHDWLFPPCNLVVDVASQLDKTKGTWSKTMQQDEQFLEYLLRCDSLNSSRSERHASLFAAFSRVEHSSRYRNGSIVASLEAVLVAVLLH